MYHNALVKFLGNFTLTQLVKKMIFHKTLRSISMCKRGCHWTYPEPFEQIPQTCTLFLTAILIHACLYPPVSPSLQKEQLKFVVYLSDPLLYSTYATGCASLSYFLYRHFSRVSSPYNPSESLSTYFGLISHKPLIISLHSTLSRTKSYAHT